MADPLWQSVCTQDDVRDLPFCDETLALTDRVKDYVSRIPTEVQISMMGNQAAGFDELHIPPYQWWSEGLHGPLEPCVSYNDQCSCPTSFPSPSAMGNAFNRTLYHLVGHAIGREGRAISNLRPHDMSIGDGLTYWSPTINMQRDPRWGRNQEVPGEDPYLTGEYAKAFVNGLQGAYTSIAVGKGEGDDRDRVRVGACCKHYLANSLERWGNVSRHNFDAKIDDQDLHDYYLPPFKECVKEAVGVMCSYNAINGIPACAHPYLLQGVLREQWNFTGYLVTDCGALGNVYNGHHYAKDPKEASALAKNATVDVNCGDGSYFPTALMAAYQEGSVQESVIQESFYRMAMVQFRLGLFDTREKENVNPLEDIATIGSSTHTQLALEAAQQSIVLLKNENNLLPLDRGSKEQIAVIGPHIHSTFALLSNYHGKKCDCTKNRTNDWSCVESPLQALQRIVTDPDKLLSMMGCNIDGMDRNEIDDAKVLAESSDKVIVFVGLTNDQEREELDRTETTLPGLQQTLLQSILDVASEKTIVVLIHGGAMSLGSDAIESSGAILTAGYGGQAASAAIADVLFGDYDPSGKLSSMWYPPEYVKQVPLTEMGLRVGVGRTHMYYTGTPEFAFGHGLSYSSWQLSWAEDTMSQNVLGLRLYESQTISLGVNLQNLGGSRTKSKSRQTLLLFWRPEKSEKHLPKQKLIDFQESSSLEEGEVQTVHFELRWDDFATWRSHEKATTVVPGRYELCVTTNGVMLSMSLEVTQSKSAGAAIEYGSMVFDTL
ncbi:glycoside hydrolase [Nitzschia inconspicua]|uniref:Glycoside hydrolase n=1 Tax=Nitzschia inconspicua TaxID=303405 RepID=A0A9K3KLV5_9STRA|nr:glycoside hydrolase [Nitzschia inconspicua]KAG7346085.1 glycoside hydrolase [Nitzschia inconspicua]